mgnify:CR=1 FL=1
MNVYLRPATPAGLRVGIIGLGRMGLRHLQAVRQLGMEPVGLADLSDAALDTACKQHGLDRSIGYADATAMLKQTRPQAVVIATTAPSHAALTLAAIDGGAHYLLCEKPMAASLQEADDMIDACNGAGARLAINHQMRFMAQYTRVKTIVGSESLGPLVSILVAGSNFGLAMNASHYFEMFRYMTGQPVTDVQAWFEEKTLANPRGAQFQDRSGRLLARSAAGPAMYIDFSADAGWGLQVVYICRYGQIVVDELSGDVRVAARKPEFRDQPTSRYGLPVDVHLEAVEPADTVVPTMKVWQAMLDGSGWPDGAAGRHALACLVATHVSHDSGRAVRIDDDALPRAEQFPWA